MHIVTEKDAAQRRHLRPQSLLAPPARPSVLRTGERRRGGPSPETAPSSSAATAPWPIPAAMRRVRLSGRTGAGLDPCAADSDPARTGRRAGAGDRVRDRSGRRARPRLSSWCSASGVRPAPARRWRRCGRTGIAPWAPCIWRLPTARSNVLANGWLIYQTLSCRFWGRSGYYQSGGAYGFRDQLQDTMALIHATPWIAREHLLRSRRAPVPRGRRAALVASTRWARRADAFVGRLPVAAVRDLPVRALDRRHRRARRTGGLPRRSSNWVRTKRPTTTCRSARPKSRLSTSIACVRSSTACVSVATDCRSWAPATGTTA